MKSVPSVAGLLRRTTPRRRLVVAATALVALLASYFVVVTTTASAADALLSRGKPVVASSQENAGTPPSSAVDGNAGTRWSSQFSDPQWIRIDLGATYNISQVVLTWEAAYGRSFQLQVSNDLTTWTSVYSTTTGPGGVQTLTVSGTTALLGPLPTATRFSSSTSTARSRVRRAAATRPSTPLRASR
jgi:hypothetical protein